MGGATQIPVQKLPGKVGKVSEENVCDVLLNREEANKEQQDGGRV